MSLPQKACALNEPQCAVLTKPSGAPQSTGSCITLGCASQLDGKTPYAFVSGHREINLKLTGNLSAGQLSHYWKALCRSLGRESCQSTHPWQGLHARYCPARKMCQLREGGMAALGISNSFSSLFMSNSCLILLLWSEAYGCGGARCQVGGTLYHCLAKWSAVKLPSKYFCLYLELYQLNYSSVPQFLFSYQLFSISFKKFKADCLNIKLNLPTQLRTLEN